MRINSLKVKNFKGFEEREFHFPSPFTLIIGENGAGKTSVAEAAAAALAVLTDFTPGRIQTGYQNPLQADLVRLTRQKIGSATRFEQQLPAYAKANVEHQGKHVETVSQAGELRLEGQGYTRYRTETREAVMAGSPITLPILGMYSSERLPAPVRSLPDRTQLELSRLHGYEGCMANQGEFTDVEDWLREEELVSLQEGTRSQLLAVVTAAIAKCIPGATSVHYGVRDRSIIVTFEDQSERLYHTLSDGQRIMLSLVADIAYRAAWMNPHLEGHVLDETDGIVLIDELDLHLHPKWQRTVVDDLRRTFPKIQFIATSHSPFIIQSLRPNELLDLDSETPIEYANKGVEEIARYVQGVEMPYTSDRYLKRKAAAAKYFALLQEGRKLDDPKLMEAKDQLDAVTAHFADNPAADAFMELQRIAAEGKNGA
jgi:predicted ATP-binding protein involved in virulence